MLSQVLPVAGNALRVPCEHHRAGRVRGEFSWWRHDTITYGTDCNSFSQWISERGSDMLVRCLVEDFTCIMYDYKFTYRRLSLYALSLSASSQIAVLFQCHEHQCVIRGHSRSYRACPLNCARGLPQSSLCSDCHVASSFLTTALSIRSVRFPLYFRQTWTFSGTHSSRVMWVPVHVGWLDVLGACSAPLFKWQHAITLIHSSIFLYNQISGGPTLRQ
jgi:hypothetical protein